MLVLEVAECGFERLVEEGQVDLGEIEQFLAQFAVFSDRLARPCRDPRADPGRACAADDDGYMLLRGGHVGGASLGYVSCRSRRPWCSCSAGGPGARRLAARAVAAVLCTGLVCWDGVVRTGWPG